MSKDGTDGMHGYWIARDSHGCVLALAFSQFEADHWSEIGLFPQHYDWFEPHPNGFKSWGTPGCCRLEKEPDPALPASARVEPDTWPVP